MVGINAYRKADIETASIKNLIIKKYETIITNLWRLHENHPIHPEFFIWKSNAINGLDDLYISLDFSRGELSELFGNLYGYMISQIAKDSTGENAKEIIYLLETLLEGWKGIK